MLRFAAAPGAAVPAGRARRSRLDTHNIVGETFVGLRNYMIQTGCDAANGIPKQLLVGSALLECNMRLTNKAARALFLLAVLPLSLGSCAEGKRAFLTVQLCVRDRDGVSQLTDELRAVAVSNGMKFIDGSKAAERELATTGYAERSDGSPVVNVGVVRGDGLAALAGNVGLPDYHIAVGFLEGSDSSEALRFADSVIKRLETHWQIDKLPADSGTLPRPGCR
jgi:hypothetical protein